MKKLLYPFVISLTFIIYVQNFGQQSDFPHLNNNEILSIASKNSLVIASSYQTGIVISTNSGDNWFQTNPTISFQPYESVSVADSGYLFALGFDGYLYKSTDIGSTWVLCSSITFYNGPEILTDYSTGYIYISSHLGIYRSTDEGSTWSEMNNGLVVGGSSPFTRTAISNDGILVASTPSGIFKSIDNSNTWIRLSFMGATVIAINSVGYIFADKYSEDPYFYSDTLYRSTDDGINWTKLNQQVSTLVFVNPVNDAIVTTLYNYTQNYSLSTDYGISWDTIFSEKSPQCMSYNGSNNYFMGTSGAGIFKSNSLNGPWQFCVITSIENPEEVLINSYYLFQNYPNPFNSSTKIKFSLPKSSNVLLKVFDSIGNEIETLVNEFKSSGTYEITWYAANLPSGIYFYQIRSNSFIGTRKLILLK
jgi:photosystem II stability/assembly factor-like uncharacterized protein